MTHKPTTSQDILKLMEDGCSRNLVAKVGKHTLEVSSLIAMGVGIATAPKTTLGVAAIGAGLVAIGNRKELDDWGQATFRKKDADPAVTAQTVEVTAS